ncbi:hypothetical protein [Methylobacterium mesophilicum]
MSGLAVKLNIADAVRDAQAAFAEYGLDRFPRALQFGLTDVAIDGVNRFRREIPNIWERPNRATRDALRYAVDKDMLGRIASVGEASAAVFVQDVQSIWLKYSFGEGPQVRAPGDVGIEAYFGDQMSIRVPVNDNLARTGFGRAGPGGKIAGRDAKRVAALAAARYDRNTAGGTRGSGSWGVFEIKPGETSRQHGYFSGPGIYARPPAHRGRRRQEAARQGDPGRQGGRAHHLLQPARRVVRDRAEGGQRRRAQAAVPVHAQGRVPGRRHPVLGAVHGGRRGDAGRPSGLRARRPPRPQGPQGPVARRRADVRLTCAQLRPCAPVS